jgi:DNA-binding IclR family transcriptional regulator
MTPPCPIFALRAGLHNLTDLAILWHLAKCGATGSTVQDIQTVTRLAYNSVYGVLRRLQDLDLVTTPRGGQGRSSAHWTISRLGYALATHNDKQKPADPALPIPSITLTT